ncbi:MAG: four helix bundle protein [Alistipes sp.]|nr:four helix bundle protein [Alistipes sp.]MDE5694707.1 four helix bundle protein [Alistipes sp.]MDE6508547.1 four helix bundle protein [Alistipes sp.]MDE7077732.1 four helix bundle protein [Alistipes sp.]MDE7345073.1 four helix bundle protein [Alistipes sp.]
MAIYDNLPVFKATYDLLLQVVKLSVHIRRDARYTMGESLKKEIIGLCICIYRANMTSEKGPLIEEAREKLVPIKLLIRLLHDTQQLSTKQYAMLCEHLDTITKQLSAWQKYAQKDKNKSRAAEPEAADEDQNDKKQLL